MKILAIKFVQFGDIVQSLGAFQDISNHYNVKIDILTSSPYKKIFEKMPFVNNVIISNRSKRNLLKLNKTLNYQKYDLVFEMPGFGCFSKINPLIRYIIYKYVVFNNSRLITCFDVFSKKEINQNYQKKFSDHDWYHAILKKLNIRTQFTYHSPIIYAQDNSFNPPAIQKPYIFIAPFCSSPKSADHKRWPNFKALMKLLKKDFPNLNLVVAPGPEENKLADQLPAIKILDNNGKVTSIPQLIKVINQACYVISLDTGPAHVACHLGKPGRVLGGKTMEPQRLALINDDFKIIHFSKKDLNDVTADEFYVFIKSDLEKHVEALA